MLNELVQFALLVAGVVALCVGVRNDCAEVSTTTTTARRRVATRSTGEARALRAPPDVEARIVDVPIVRTPPNDVDEPPTYAEAVGRLRDP